MASVSPCRTRPPYWKLSASCRVPCRIGRQAAQNLCRRSHADIVLGEIDAGFEQGDQFQQLLLQRSQAARDGAIHLLRRDARLVERGGVDQIAHGLGLRQIDAAVQKGAQGELAGLGQARAGVERALHGVAQHDGRTVAGDLDQVLGGVGARRGEEGDHHLVDGVAVRVEQLRQVRLPGTPFGGSEELRGDGARLRSGKAHDAEAGASRRSGDGDDGVGELQRLLPGIGRTAAARCNAPLQRA